MQQLRDRLDSDSKFVQALFERLKEPESCVLADFFGGPTVGVSYSAHIYFWIFEEFVSAFLIILDSMASIL